jgi:acetyl esterase/lipase
MDIDARTDDTHREILAMLPPDLFDFSDLEGGIAQLMALLGASPVELPASVRIDDHAVEVADGHEVVVRIYRPDSAPVSSPALYWIHGGGMILGNVGMDDAHCAAIADGLGIIVASVDYRLAPEFPYPARRVDRGVRVVDE